MPVYVYRVDMRITLFFTKSFSIYEGLKSHYEGSKRCEMNRL